MNITREIPILDLRGEFRRLLILSVLIVLMVMLAVYVGRVANHEQQAELPTISDIAADHPFCYKNCTLIHP